MHYLGLKPTRPRIGVFDFTGCEGCELQLANKEETLHHFLDALTIVNFREVSSSEGWSLDVALVEGSLTREDELERINRIRANTKVLVALGSCACFGGVNRQKNSFNLLEANREVYGELTKPTLATRALKDVVNVDLEIPGCPVSKDEIERIVRHLVWDAPFSFPQYSVCFECKQRKLVCRFEVGEICLGPITRGGCDAACTAGGHACWGCRGPAADPNITALREITLEKGFSALELEERLSFFGGFEGVQ